MSTEERFIAGQVVYITKYALTAGIQFATVQEKQREYAAYVSVDWPGGYLGSAIFYPGRDMFSTIEAAQANVAAQCERKLKSLEKQAQAVRHIRAHGAAVLPVRK